MCVLTIGSMHADTLDIVDLRAFGVYVHVDCTGP
jgi:hypothetical protein